MKNLIYIVLVGCLMASCASSQKLLEKGKYEQAIDKAAKKLRKDPGNEKELGVLREAYYQANRIDQARISFLEKEDRDMNWIEIYNLYVRLDRRQDKIEALPPQVRSNFEFVNYDDAIIESKSIAASVSYNRGLELLGKGDRYSAREAYYEFERAYNLYPEYRDVAQRMDEARYKGMNHVLFTVENNSEKVLPADFDTELRKIALQELNTQWLNFDVYEDTSKYYDYFIVLNIKDIEVSPERIETKTYTESREIQDGMKYVLDEDGNVKKDSLGNDIREPNMITVTAEIEENIQQKSAFVGGSIDYVDLHSEQLVKTEGISVEAIFDHQSAISTGNSKALSDETRAKLKRKPVPFPSNETMLLDASALLKDRAKAIIARNRGILEN